MQFDPESSPELTLCHGHPQVVLAYLKYQYAVGDELKRKDAFSRLQVTFLFPLYSDNTSQQPYIQVFILTHPCFWWIGFVYADCYCHE